MPTIDIPDKICPHCGGTVWYHRPNSPNHLYCHKKIKEENKKRYCSQKDDPEIIKKKRVWMKNWREKNKEYVKAYSKNWNKSEKGKLSKRKREESYCTKLTDRYLRTLLKSDNQVKFSRNDFSDEDVQTQKKMLLIKRELGLTSYQKRGKNIVNIPDKVCSHCGGTTWTKQKFPCKSNPNAFRYRCVKLVNETCKKSREKKLSLQLN